MHSGPSSLQRLGIILFIGLFAIFLNASSNVYANSTGVSPRWKKLVDDYLDEAFSNGKVELRKFNVIGEFPTGIECQFIDQTICSNVKETFKQSFDQNGKLLFSESSNPMIRFVFTDDFHISDLSSKAREDFPGDGQDTSDPQCEVFYQLLNSQIQAAQILVSVGQSTKKIRACLAFQTAQSMGISMTGVENFSLAWGANRGGGMSVFSDQEMNAFQHSVTVLEFVQMCNEISPGMHMDQVKRILLSEKSCISELVGVK